MLNVGSVVVSKMGHDAGKVYVIVDICGDFALVADGKTRKITNPKKKRLKHLKDTFVCYDGQKDKFKDFEIVTFLKNTSICTKI